MVAAPISGLPVDDLIAVDSQGGLVQLLTRIPAATGTLLPTGEFDMAGSQPKVISLDSVGEAVAALPMKLNGDAMSDLAVLRKGQSTPIVVTSVPSAIITVNSSADTNVRDSVITLREAILLSNGELLKANLTAQEQAQVSGTPAPGLDEVRFSIPAAAVTAVEGRTEEATRSGLTTISQKQRADDSTLTMREERKDSWPALATNLIFQPRADEFPAFAMLKTSFSDRGIGTFPHLTGAMGLNSFLRAGPQPSIGTSSVIPKASHSTSTTEPFPTGSPVAFACDTQSYEFTNYQGASPSAFSQVGMVLGDYNSDGRQDVIGVYNSGEFSFLAGLGENGLALPLPQFFDTGFNNPSAVASTDFNGDGRLDLVVATNNPYVLFGNGNGGFSRGPNILNSTSTRVAVADFDADGLPDIVFGTNNSTIAVVLNKGNNTFGEPTNFPVIQLPLSIAIDDFNRDNKLDLALVNNESVSILLGTGTGSFGASTNFSVGCCLDGIAVGDFNGDGNRDLAVVSSNRDTVSVMRGNGTGGFGVPFNFSVGTNPNSIVAGDFNNDGRLDIAVVSSGSNNISVLRGNGTGGFSAAVNYPVGSGPKFIAAKDMTGDGQLDLVVMNGFFSQTVTVLKGKGDATFTRTPSYIASTNPYAVATADFNGDNRPDVAVVNNNTFGFINAGVTILLNDGTGVLGAPTLFPVSPFNPIPIGIGVGDFNGDSSPDLAVLSANVGLSILLGNGAGGFGTATNINVSVDFGAIVVRDFNGDGKLDLAVQNGANVGILLGNGSGGFGAPTNFPVGGNPQALASGDFNGDGKLDLVAPFAFAGRRVAILLGNGNGTFGPATSFTTPVGNSLAVGDFDGDSTLDLALRGSSFVAIFFGSGQGTFSAPTQYSVGSDYPIQGVNLFGSIIALDFHGDGSLDLVTTNPGAGNLSFLSNLGGGGFRALPGLHAGSQPNGLAFADFNSDGKPDFLTANYASNDVSLIFNTCSIGPDLALTKTHTGNFTVGENGTYNFTVTNTGQGATTGTITLRDNLPAGLSYVSSSGANWSCSALGQAVTCTQSAAIEPNASSNLSITVGVAVAAAPAVTNQVTISTLGEFAIDNNSASDPTTVIQPCALLPITVGQTVNGALATSDCRSQIRGANDTLPTAIPLAVLWDNKLQSH